MQTPPSDYAYLSADRFRTFRHPDGREWKVRALGAEVEIEITLPDGESVQRKVATDAPKTAQARLKELVEEQLAEGFVETTFDCLLFVRDAAELWQQARAPTPETLPTIASLLRHPDFRIAVAAAKLLAEYAFVDAAFEPLWSHHHRAQREDGYAWALMRASELRHDLRLLPFLEAMLADPRFDGPGYPERIRDAIAGLTGPRH